MVRRLTRVLFAAAVAAAVGVGTGCVNMYPSDPNKRMEVLINQSEDYRQISGTWQRFWFNDQPSHMTPERIHGGIF